MQQTLCMAMICVLAYQWHCRQDALKQCMPCWCITDRQTDRQTDRRTDGQKVLLKRDIDDAISFLCLIREVNVALSQCLLKVVA